MEAARPATTEDLPRIVDLAAQLVAELADQRGGALFAVRDSPAPPLDAHYRARYTDEASLLGAGLVDDTVAGFVSVVAEELRDGTQLAVVEALFVEPGFRGVGVGECLADLAVGWAAARGCRGIDAIALPGNRAAKNFFEAHGFVARSIVMHRTVAAGDGA